MKKWFFILFLITSITFAQTEQNDNAKDYAKNILKIALHHEKDKSSSKKTKLIIPDEETAISVAEPILFKIYKKENITFQKPYKINFIDKYWIIVGTLPEGLVGGTFEIILDATNSKVLWISHGK